jgi:HPt (histidine-containing phosphotransfer) domain-containing protein
MTANAMASDRAACLAAGMNEHVGKPFELSDLVGTLRRLTGRADASDAGDVGDGNGAGGPAPGAGLRALPPQCEALADRAGLELQAAIGRLGGNAGVYGRMLRNFLGELPATLERLRGHLDGRDWSQAAQVMHTVKGLAGMVGARELQALAAQAERTLDAARVPGAPAPAPAALDGLQRGLGPMTDRLLLEGAALLPLLLGAPAGAADDPATGQAPPPALPPEARRELLGELFGLLQASDMRALQLLERLLSAPSGLPPSGLQALEASIERLDFDRASSLCRSLIEETDA